MTVESFAKTTGFKTLCMPSPDKEIDGAYIGDLLSWVMGKAESGNVWITIMSNLNVVAVATLADVSAILLCEGVLLDGEVLALAESKGVNVLATDYSAFEVAKIISGAV